MTGVIYSHQVLSSPHYCLQHKRSMHTDAGNTTNVFQTKLSSTCSVFGQLLSFLLWKPTDSGCQSVSSVSVGVAGGRKCPHQSGPQREDSFPKPGRYWGGNILNCRVKTLRSKVRGGGGSRKGRGWNLSPLQAQTDRMLKNNFLIVGLLVYV